MKRARFLFLLAWASAMVLTSIVTGAANAAKLLTMVQPDNLVSVDTDTRQVTVIGPIGYGAEDFSFSPAGTLFAAADYRRRWPHGAAQTLITVNTTTGAGTIVGPIGFGDVDAIAFAPDGTLFGANAGRQALLIRIDPATGAGTGVGLALTISNYTVGVPEVAVSLQLQIGNRQGLRHGACFRCLATRRAVELAGSGSGDSGQPDQRGQRRDVLT